MTTQEIDEQIKIFEQYEESARRIGLLLSQLFELPSPKVSVDTIIPEILKLAQDGRD
jgi:hypothetical protein